ncbi:MAG: hypothetical protein CVT99_02320 [Bacteroidetes bacterium HGW-Bacteroidetes-16]|jgi:hypothetical protein|nr:MAG: hypothetical protein CVT99_02320 [Bacteroidetes bacterium HGW-Bacteroidetes-16]
MKNLKKTIEQLFKKSTLLRCTVKRPTSTSYYYFNGKNSYIVITIDAETVKRTRFQGDFHLNRKSTNVIFDTLKSIEYLSERKDVINYSSDNMVLFNQAVSKFRKFQRANNSVTSLTKTYRNGIYQHDDYISNLQFANKMGVSRRTTHTWRSKGLVPFSKFQGRVYYKVSDIHNMLDAYSNRPVMDLI